MESKLKSKLSIKESHFQELYENNPDSFEVVTNTIKIYSQRDNFFKNMQLDHTMVQFLFNSLGVTYYGYFQIMLHSMNYDNVIDFKLLKRLGVKKGMIDICKKKFISVGIIKKYQGDFYVNPDIAVKGEKINPNIKKLFE